MYAGLWADPALTAGLAHPGLSPGMTLSPGRAGLLAGVESTTGGRKAQREVPPPVTQEQTRHWMGCSPPRELLGCAVCLSENTNPSL